MEITEILELLGREHLLGNEVTSGFLEDAAGIFQSNPTSAASAIRKLQSNDPSGFALAAARMLISAEGAASPALHYIAGLVTAGHGLIDPLLDERVLSRDAAVELARKVAAAEPMLDVLLIRRMVEKAGGDATSAPTVSALHALELVGAISDCSRLASQLARFLRHPSARVRSKAALLLGRANWNLTRLKSLLASDDVRVRANAVESLWGYPGEEVRRVLWDAVKDPSGRVVVNALLGLCQMGDREAYSRLETLAETDPLRRSGAAWAMGETGDPHFREALKKLEQDSDSKVRVMAQKSAKKLRDLETMGQALSPEAPSTGDSEPVTVSPD